MDVSSINYNILDYGSSAAFKENKTNLSKIENKGHKFKLSNNSSN